MSFLVVFLACTGSLCLGYGAGVTVGRWGALCDHLESLGAYLDPEDPWGDATWEAEVVREGQERPYDWSAE